MSKMISLRDEIEFTTYYHDNTLFLDDYTVRGVVAKEILVEVEDDFTT